ncbi:ATP-binding cassette domain-containing protein [Thiothrix nivea]|uniref:ATP-binding cassette domain-containing protein n=1 Tax=Thiothrix nivea TaxID=1031 RepID=UPI000594E7ED|nr:ATP-binding cassette domain-containing protein [Thiothrix nivea]
MRELELSGLRQAISLVSQEVYLFPGTIYENIRYGNPDSTYADVVEAARMAEALEFIDKLPDGFDSPVSERGQNLSGGQRQRLSITRAILKKAPVMILDEATSAVDNETEAAIQRSIAGFSQGRTTIIIAHRLSTIRHADRRSCWSRESLPYSPCHTTRSKPSATTARQCKRSGSRYFSASTSR